MQCQYPKCRNLATVTVRKTDLPASDAFNLCDECFDFMREALAAHNIDPDNGPVEWVVTQCLTL